MTRFATVAGLTLVAVVLGTTHRASAQTSGIETAYPAPSGTESKSPVIAYSAPPRAATTGIETAYPANYQPRVNNFPQVETGPPLPAGGIRPGPGATSLGVGPTPATVAPGAPAASGAPAVTGLPTAPGTNTTTALPTDTTLPPDVGTIPLDTTAGTAAPATVVYPTIVGSSLGVAPSASGAQLIPDPYGGSGPAYYLPPTSQPLYLPPSRNNTTVPSTNVWRNSAMPTVVNPALYSNGVIVRQARSPNPYDGPRYVVTPARR